MRPKPAQLSVIAVAALAIFAVAAVMLLAGGNPAQATTTATSAVAPDDSGGGIHLRPMHNEEEEEPTPEPTPTPTPTPRTFAPEPACPEQAAPVVDSGHIALFDVWWNPEEGELTNTSCPPTVVHVSGTKASDTRSPSGINIAETVIHIPNSAKIDLSASDTPYTQAKYPELWAADDKEDRNNSGMGDRLVWALPACPPDGPSSSTMCLSFSAALLNEADWEGVTADNDGDEKGGIEYHIDHVHQIDIDKQDPRYTLVYDAYDADATGENEAIWDSSNAQVNVMRVAPGGYERPMWFFTSRGTYEFQVHIRGKPVQDADQLGGLEPLGTEDSVTSDVREYTVHVGAEANLGVSVSVEPELAAGDTTLDPGDAVNIHIQATNQGPEAAPATKVEVTLPEGLTNVRKDSVEDDYNSSTGVWNVGNLVSGANDNLLLTATVADETHGQELAVKATISATETLVITESAEDGQKVAKTYHVPVLDPNPANDMATGTTTVATKSNVDPMFRITRSVAENLPTGTLVGAPVPAFDQNSDGLTYSLSGDHSAKFEVDEQGQISLSWCGVLDYESQSSYSLVLSVSDGKDRTGNTDTSIDHTIGVLVQVTDVDDASQPSPAPGLSLSADSTSLSLNHQMTLTAEPLNMPSCDLTLRYSWSEQDPAHTGTWATTQGSTATTREFTHSSQGSRLFKAEGVYRESSDDPQYVISNDVVVNWQ